ncbi:MAG TPA: hypothetical protein VGB79_09700 [Allosphingosinicella sp.]|jgi:hypothetical protein
MTKARSKLILALSAYFAFGTALSLYTLAVEAGSLGVGQWLYQAVMIAICAAVAFGLYRHLRWALWLYLASAVVAFAGWAAGDPLAPIDPKYHTAVVVFMVLALVVPGVLMWIRRDRLSPSSIEQVNAQS